MKKNEKEGFYIICEHRVNLEKILLLFCESNLMIS